MARVTQRALRWIQTHSPEQITEKVPTEFQGSDAALYLQALRHSVVTFSPEGRMTPQGPAVLISLLAIGVSIGCAKKQ
jgi:NitT/TauT family transport system substrate-binding protein